VRSRPGVKLLLSPAVVTPSTRLLAETVLVSKSKTPVDYVSVTLRCHVFTAAGTGRTRGEAVSVLYHREWRSPPSVLTPGEHRYRVAFDLPATLPPTYTGTDARVDYSIVVHVAIPWWRDRIDTFTVKVAPPQSPEAPAARPRSFATSNDGPRGTKSFMEVALETTELAVGDVLVGSVSLQNLRGKRIRGLEVAIVEVEEVTQPSHEAREARRFSVRVHDGTPHEGEPIPFRVTVPDGATPGFNVGPLVVKSHAEVRAVVAWGEDVIVRPPLVVVPRASAQRSEVGWVAPVGRERRALVWQRVAQRSSLSIDPRTERMFGARRTVTIEVRAQEQDGDFWLVAKLGWDSLGLDLEIGEKKWTDVLALDVVKSGDQTADARFVAHAREHAQARPVVTGELMAALLPFERVEVDDSSAELASRGSAHTTELVETFVQAVLGAAEAIANAAERVPAPLLFEHDVVAWRAFAERLRGTLELGKMQVRDGLVGSERVTIGTEWTKNGALVGTRIEVAIDPRLETPPASPDDPAISPAARDVWRHLAGRVAAVRVESDAVFLELEGKLADPGEAMPTVELAVALRRALAGIKGAGPFR
jgi:hypothetical protein